MNPSGMICLLMTLCLAAIPAYAGSPAKISVNGGTLHGTLELPAGKAPCPVALIIPGSGPTDRDGNNPLAGGKNNSLKMLAEALAANGIASLRYDKRGISQSAPAMLGEKDLRFETYIGDAAMWVKELRQNQRFTRVVIIGHSEGSLIGMVACRKSDADAFVSIAGAGIPASDLLLSQLQPKLPQDLFNAAADIVDRLNHGQITDSLPPALMALFRESVQPYLISWFRYDPASEIAKLEIPVLIVQGSTDIQVDMENAKVLADSNRLARRITIDGMNHILKKVAGNLQEQVTSYGDPSLPIAEELVEELTAFVLSLETVVPDKNRL